MEGSRWMLACSTVRSGVAHLTHLAPPPSPPCVPAPPPHLGPALLFHSPSREGLSSLSGPTPAHPLHTWLPCGLAGGLAPQRCSEPSADWPGPVARGMIRIAKGGSTPPAWLTRGEGGVGTHLGKGCHNHVFSMSVGRCDIRKGDQGDLLRAPIFQLLLTLCPQLST